MFKSFRKSVLVALLAGVGLFVSAGCDQVAGGKDVLVTGQRLWIPGPLRTLDISDLATF